MRTRLVFSDWIYELSSTSAFEQHPDSDLRLEITENVRNAVKKLPSSEQEFVQLYWFEGRSLAELSRLLDRRQSTLDGIKRQIVKKLKWLLAGYVTARFRGVQLPECKCPICNHPRRDEIDLILLAKRPCDTYGTVCRRLRERFGLIISTPQIIIGHVKYHTDPGGYRA